MCGLKEMMYKDSDTFFVVGGERGGMFRRSVLGYYLELGSGG